MTTDASITAHLAGGLADRDSWTAERCSVDRAFGIVGTRSGLLILREAYYGATRFDEFARRVGITEAVTSTRLKQLTEAGLLRREPYREPGQRTRYDYRLTDKGLDLVPVVLALMQWGDTWLTGGAGAPLAMTHTDCGAPVHVEVRCEAGHDVGLGELTIRGRRRRAAADS